MSQNAKKRRLSASNVTRDENDEESNLLAALRSSVHNMDQYEQDVLKSAELEGAPKLITSNQGLLGFPPLQALAPSGRAFSDLPHAQTLLSKIRGQLHQQPHNLSLLLKQQMLLNFVHTTTNDFDLCLRPQEELRHEQVRRKRFQRQVEQQLQKEKSSQSYSSKRRQLLNKEKPTSAKVQGAPKSALKRSSKGRQDEGIAQDSDEEAGSRLESIKAGSQKSVSFATTSNKAPRRRIGIQKRRKLQAQGEGQGGDVDHETDEEWNRRKASIRKRREEREKRRQKRREKWIEEQQSRKIASEESSEDEKEFDFDATVESATEEQAVANAASTVTAESPEVPTKEENSATVVPISVASCPICQESIEAPSAGEVDAALSKHMAECQTSRRRTRGSRQSTERTRVSKVSYVEEDIEEDERKPAGRRLSEQIDNDEAFEQIGVDEDDEELIADESPDDTYPRQYQKGKKKSASTISNESYTLRRAVDDFDEEYYEDRVDDWIDYGIGRMRKMKERDETEQPPGEEILEGGLTIPAWVNDRLFPYQRTGLQWMWELHRQQAGGIIGDEMGLGKTVQLAAFLGCMAASRKLKSILVIAPATMLQHWLNEVKVWAPGLRRILIHQSADDSSFTYAKRTISHGLLQNLDEWLKDCRRSRLFEAIDEADYESRDPSSFCGTGYIVVTTYENVRRFADVWTSHRWSYVVMDEAQKIRNPDADVTLVCKRLRTPHRLALSGTPIQNDLRELWSLFDFVFPGRLGTLPAFENEFADPIKRGGYSNASPMQVQLAYRCALMLRGLINPYLLRRLKKDIKEVNRMPGKKEQVLFCRLSDRQRTMYEAFLQSDQVKQVLRGTAQMLGAVTTLRKICNHPDLICPPDKSSLDTFVNKGYFTDADLLQDYSDDDMLDAENEEESVTERSGKLEVLAKILPLWKKQGHRVLIFCQWKKMLNIIQRFTESKGWKFGRLDGSTNVAARQRLVDNFNSDESYYGMLMTTRTGGVGLNLTGADRIILYDPDWNPQTDAQARERAWRFGQEREVTIYRLIAAGTVEEKIYQRQIFKTALSNRVLQDPRQRRLFSQKDLKDLFSLKIDEGSVISGGDGLTETGQLTKGEGYIDPDTEAVSEETNKDDGETMQSVLQSKGLAGVFDHGVVENSSTSKKASVREMEEKAKEVARAAAGALKQSVAGQRAFTPTWTGTEESSEGRFGANHSHDSMRGRHGVSGGLFGNGSGNGKASSTSLLASIRKQQEDVRTGGNTSLATESTRQYTDLLFRIKEFVRRQAPTTEELLFEFDSVQEHDAAVFRRLLRSVAGIQNGRWKLKKK